ncbi:MAG: PDZ domain-containing protein, partial [Prevotella sp.]
DLDLGTNEGIYVSKVENNSAGEAAGLKEGDVIVAVDGKKVTKMSELQELMAGKRPGDKLTITYLHNKNKESKTVTLKNAQGNTNIMKSADLDVLGGNFRTVTEQQKNELKIGYGLEVIKVNDGALKKAGIGKGLIILDVNDTPMKSLSDLQNAVKSASTAKDPVLYIKGVWPTGKKDYFAIQIGQ